MTSLSYFPYFVYIIQSETTGIFYKGFTENYLKRLSEHNTGLSRFTNGKGPWKLVYLEELADKRSALIRERKLKKTNINYLMWLIDQPINKIKK